MSPAHTPGFCGPLRRVNLESAEFCITGSRFGQPVGLVKDEFYGIECGALDAPNYVPRGSVSTFASVHGNTLFAECSGLRQVYA